MERAFKISPPCFVRIFSPTKETFVPFSFFIQCTAFNRYSAHTLKSVKILLVYLISSLICGAINKIPIKGKIYSAPPFLLNQNSLSNSFRKCPFFKENLHKAHWKAIYKSNVLHYKAESSIKLFPDKNTRVKDCHINIGDGKWPTIKFNFLSKLSFRNTIHKLLEDLLLFLPITERCRLFSLKIEIVSQINHHFLILKNYTRHRKNFQVERDTRSVQTLVKTELF